MHFKMEERVLFQVDDHQKDDEQREGDSEDEHRQEKRDHCQGF